jgi:hypothetical protein
MIFSVGILLSDFLQAQGIEFSVDKFCIDSTAHRSEGLNPICLSFTITVKNRSAKSRTIFRRELSSKHIDYGRLVVFDEKEKKYFHQLIRPELNYGKPVRSVGLRPGDSAQIMAVIYLSDAFRVYKARKQLVSDGHWAALFRDMIRTGRIYYVPGKIRRDLNPSASLPGEAIEISKPGAGKIVMSAGCPLLE